MAEYSVRYNIYRTYSLIIRFMFELIYEYFLSKNLDRLYDIFRIFFFFSFPGSSFNMYFW